MTTHGFIHTSLGSALALAVALTLTAGAIASSQGPLALDTARVSIAGTSNIHDYTASTTEVLLTRVQFAAGAAGPALWDEVQKPGGLEAFDISISAASLKSTKEGLDKNMYKALKVKEHADITFSLTRMEGAAGTPTAFGTLRVAGVEREVTIPLKATRKGAGLAVTGELAVLMTDFGIAPPRAMLGMVTADPRITITFEVLLAIATT